MKVLAMLMHSTRHSVLRQPQPPSRSNLLSSPQPNMAMRSGTALQITRRKSIPVL